MRTPLLALFLALTACRTPPKPVPAKAAPPELVAPTLRLPEGVVPLSYALNLTVVPGERT